MLGSQTSNPKVRWELIAVSTPRASGIQHQARASTPTCFVTDHLSLRREFESQFVRLLGMDLPTKKADYRKAV